MFPQFSRREARLIVPSLVFLVVGVGCHCVKPIIQGGENTIVLQATGGQVTIETVLAGAGGVEVVIPAQTGIALMDGTTPEGVLVLSVDDGVSTQGMTFPEGLRPVALVGIGIKADGAGINAVFGSEPEENVAKEDAAGVVMRLPAEFLEQSLGTFLLYVLVDSSGAPIQPSEFQADLGKFVLTPKEESEQALSGWKYVAQGRGDADTPFPIPGTGIYGVFSSTATPPVPRQGYELQFQTPGRVSRLKLIEAETAEVLGIWYFSGRTTGFQSLESVGPKTSGPEDKRFWCWLEPRPEGDLVHIRSGFANRPSIRAIYKNGGVEASAEGLPAGPFPVTDGTLGVAIAEPYNDCSLPFAGEIRLRVTSSFGDYTHFRTHTLEPLRAVEGAVPGSVILGYFRASGPLGYFGEIRVDRRHCIDDSLDVLLQPYTMNLKNGRFAQVQYDDFDLQRAINETPAGATLVVPPGRYEGGATIGGKPIVIRSVNPADPVSVNETILTAPIRFWGVGRDTILDGFTITGAVGDSAISIGVNNSPTIRNCVITGNQATEGAGMIIRYYGQEKPAPLIQNCLFEDNHAVFDPEHPTKWARGGAIYVMGGNAEIVDCVFRGNSAEYSGGAVSCEGWDWMSGTTTLRGNLFVDNKAGTGDGMYFGAGGGLYIRFMAPVVHGNTFLNNRCLYSPEEDPSSMYIALGGGIHNDRNDGDPLSDLADNVFSGNYPADIFIGPWVLSR